MDIYSILTISLHNYNFNFLNKIYVFFFTLIYKSYSIIYLNFHDKNFFTIIWSLSILINTIQEILYINYSNFKFFKMYFFIIRNNKSGITNIFNNILEVKFLLNYNKSFYKILYKLKKNKFILTNSFYGYMLLHNIPNYLNYLLPSDFLINNIFIPISYINFNLIFKLSNIFFIKFNNLIIIKKMIVFLNIISYINNIILINKKFYN